MSRPVHPLSTSDWAVLAFLSENEAHGFRLAAAFARGGELGSVWTLQRPQVYRALEHLEARAFITPLRKEASESGPPRTLYALTDLGTRELHGWLSTPVRHLREGPSDLLLKLVFLERHERDPQPLLVAQSEIFDDILKAYEGKLAGARGPERTALEWRIEAARAALRFLDLQQRPS